MKEKLKKYLMILLGLILVGAAVSLFYTPNKIVSGGVSGFSTIVYYVLHIPVGVTSFVINFLLLAFSYKILGKEFTLSTFVGSFLVSLFIQLFSYFPPVTHDKLLAAVFGSVLYGFGIGLTLICGSSSGGTDIIARLVQVKKPHIKIGSLLLAVDLTVILISLIVFGNFDLVLFGIIALVMSSLSINELINKLNISKLAFVVTDFGTEIAENLIKASSRGVTVYDAIGGYTKDKKKVLMCALKNSETEGFQQRILEIDKDAFIIFADSTQIVGNGFRVYK